MRWRSDVLFGVFAAGRADLHLRHGGFLRAQFVIHLELDRQTVAIPTGDVGRIVALHSLQADDEILEQLVERVAQVDVTVGVGRAVVQNIGRTAFAGFPDAGI